MNHSKVNAGSFYSDGKSGIREVLSITGNAGEEQVEYRVLAAQVMQKYSPAAKEMVSVIGTVASCTLDTFAAWSRIELSKTECDEVMIRLNAHRVKLSPGELAFMESALDEAGGEITPGTMISFDHTEGRAVGGLEKKGMVVRNKGEVEVTELGAAWFRHQSQLRIEG